MTAFPPDPGDSRTMVMVPAAPDYCVVHVVLLPVGRFLLHTAPETEHGGDYSHGGIMTVIFGEKIKFDVRARACRRYDYVGRIVRGNRRELIELSPGTAIDGNGELTRTLRAKRTNENER